MGIDHRHRQSQPAASGVDLEQHLAVGEVVALGIDIHQPSVLGAPQQGHLRFLGGGGLGELGHGSGDFVKGPGRGAVVVEQTRVVLILSEAGRPPSGEEHRFDSVLDGLGDPGPHLTARHRRVEGGPVDRADLLFHHPHPGLRSGRTPIE